MNISCNPTPLLPGRGGEGSQFKRERLNTTSVQRWREKLLAAMAR